MNLKNKKIISLLYIFYLFIIITYKSHTITVVILAMNDILVISIYIMYIVILHDVFYSALLYYVIAIYIGKHCNII